MSSNIQEWNTLENILDRLWLYGERNISQCVMPASFSIRLPISYREVMSHCARLTKMEDPVDFARFKAWLEHM